MIQFSKRYVTSDEESFNNLPDAQRHEISLLFVLDNDGQWLPNGIAEKIIGHWRQISEVMKARERQRVRKPKTSSRAVNHKREKHRDGINLGTQALPLGKEAKGTAPLSQNAA